MVGVKRTGAVGVVSTFHTDEQNNSVAKMDEMSRKNDAIEVEKIASAKICRKNCKVYPVPKKMPSAAESFSDTCGKKLQRVAVA